MHKNKGNIIYLIRHGEIDAGRDSNGNMLHYGHDVHLSDVGRTQVQTLGKILRKSQHRPTLIVSSPLVRALQTTEILHTMLTVPVIHDQRLGQGEQKNAIDNLLIRDIVSRTWKPDPEEEHDLMMMIVAGMLDAIQEHIQKHPKDIIAYVSHGDHIRLCLYGLIHGIDCRLPSMGVLFRTNYIDKGEARRIQLSPDFHIREKEYIGRPLKLWRRGQRIS